jgi:flagellin-like protein
MLNIKKMMKKKGISPVIASIILIAITVAVAIAVAGWVFGLFGTYGTAGGVTVINPSLTASTGTFTATIKNDKDTAVSVVSVTATGDGGTAVVFTGISGSANAHSTGTVSATGSTDGTFTAGNAYTIKVSFSDGTIVNVIVTAS